MGSLARALAACTLALPMTAWSAGIYGGSAHAVATDAETITADLKPTWQTNGRVWALEQIGDMVLVGGEFTSVRPPGARLGSQEVPRERFAAFDVTTGDLLPCAPRFTIGAGAASVRVIESAPDESRFYVGGSFGRVSGTGVANLVALDIDDCNLTDASSFRRPGVSGQVLGLEAVGDSLYVAGEFSTVDSQSRPGLAVLGSDGQLAAARAEFDGPTRAVVTALEFGKVFVGGDFSYVNGEYAHGLVAIDAASGDVAQTFPGWLPTRSVVRALVRDEGTLYLGAEGRGRGVFDGRLAASISTGELLWKDTCLGATMALALRRGLLYSGSHAHDCSTTPGGFEEGGFRQHLLAQRTSDMTIQHWFPDTNEGFEMGVAEALGPRAMVFAGGDLWVGGEFTKVNDFTDDASQWGLARFAASPDTGVNLAPALSVSSVVAGKVRVSWTSVFDRDDESLTYELYRDGSLVDAQSAVSKEWSRPLMSFVDTTATPGSVATYRMRILEDDGENAGPLGARHSVTVADTSTQESDFDGDGYADLAIGVPREDLGPAPNAGAVQVLYGSASGATARDDLWHQGRRGVKGVNESGDRFGQVLDWGDFDADGYADLAIGVPREDIGGVTRSGTVHVLYGGVNGLTPDRDQVWHQGSEGVSGKNEEHDKFGAALAVGDFDGDGYGDLAVGVGGEDVGKERNAGRVVVLRGSASGLAPGGAQSWGQGSLGIASVPQSSEWFGDGLAAGDVTADGRDDLVIQVRAELDPAADGSRGSVIHLLKGGTLGLSAVGSQYLALGDFGVSNQGRVETMRVADVNSDGSGDLSLGVTLPDGPAVVLVHGHPEGFHPGRVVSAAEPGQDSIWPGARDGAFGDFTGDGWTDLVLDAAAIVKGTNTGLESGPSPWFRSVGKNVRLSALPLSGGTRAWLIIGSPRSDAGKVDGAGTVTAVQGEQAGIPRTVVLWHQDVLGVKGSAEPSDSFGDAIG